MKSRRSTCCSGGALIEVMLAVVLSAVTAPGLIAAQLWMVRHANAATARERAAFVADSLAGAMRGQSATDIGSTQWRASVTAMVPKGETSVGAPGTGIGSARVDLGRVAGTTRLRRRDRYGCSIRVVSRGAVHGNWIRQRRGDASGRSGSGAAVRHGRLPAARIAWR